MRGKNRTPSTKKHRLIPIKSDAIFRCGVFLSAGLLVVLFQLMLGLTAAWAGPPFFTDDPEPADYKPGELYVASQFQHSRDGNSGPLPLIEFNYGVFPNVHFHLIAPLQYDKPEGETAQYGFGDLEFGIKYRFIQETDSVPMVGTFPSNLRWGLRSSTEHPARTMGIAAPVSMWGPFLI